MNANPLIGRPGVRWFHRLVCVLVLAVGLSSGCSHDELKQSDFTGAIPVARVLLLSAQSTVNLTLQQPPSVRLAGNAGGRRVDVPPGTTVPLSFTPRGWQLGNAFLGGGELVMTPAAEGSVLLNHNAYRGRYRFVPRSAGSFDVVNDVDVEQYLKGVLAKELLPNWSLETYKAQAIVARTYAIYKIQTHGPAARFNLYCDEKDQVYGGLSAETAYSREATDATAGVVVAAGPAGEEKIFKTCFSSCCGGVGQSAADAFGDPPSPQLEAQSVGSLCSSSPYFSWGPVVVPREELTRRFRHFIATHDRPEKDLATITRIEIAAKNQFGRPVRFSVTDARGRTSLWTGEDLRRAVNTDSTPKTKLLSSYVQVQSDATAIHFVNGHGLGHGVGMCQYCSQRRAELGMSYELIVTSAFPQSKLFHAY